MVDRRCARRIGLRCCGEQCCQHRQGGESPPPGPRFPHTGEPPGNARPWLPCVADPIERCESVREQAVRCADPGGGAALRLIAPHQWFDFTSHGHSLLLIEQTNVSVHHQAGMGPECFGRSPRVAGRVSTPVPSSARSVALSSFAQPSMRSSTNSHGAGEPAAGRIRIGRPCETAGVEARSAPGFTYQGHNNTHRPCRRHRRFRRPFVAHVNTRLVPAPPSATRWSGPPQRNLQSCASGALRRARCLQARQAKK